MQRLKYPLLVGKGAVLMCVYDTYDGENNAQVVHVQK